MDNKLSKIIGNRINSLLAANEKKQKDLAEYLGVTDNTISYFVKGSRMPNVEQIKKIAEWEYFNTSVDYLLGLSDVITNNKDVQFISNYTGLDEISIRELHRLQRKKKLEENKENNTVLSDIRKSNAQNAEIDIEFLNVFLSSPFNSVFNHRDSYLYEYCKNLDKCIDLYNQVINFEIKEHYDSAYLFQQWNKFDDEIQETRKKIRVDRYLITDDFIDTLEFFVRDKLYEIKKKEEISREKLNLMYEIIVKSAGESNVNNP